jgi:hypothetical protein
VDVFDAVGVVILECPKDRLVFLPPVAARDAARVDVASTFLLRRAARRARNGGYFSAGCAD